MPFLRGPTLFTGEPRIDSSAVGGRTMPSPGMNCPLVLGRSGSQADFNVIQGQFPTFENLGSLLLNGFVLETHGKIHGFDILDQRSDRDSVHTRFGIRPKVFKGDSTRYLQTASPFGQLH